MRSSYPSGPIEAATSASDGAEIEDLRKKNQGLREQIAQLQWEKSGLEAHVEYLADAVEDPHS